MKTKKVFKDICPRCGKLKVMPEMNYGRYKAVCRQCERDLNAPPSNALIALMFAILSGAVVVLCLLVHDQGAQLTRLQSRVYEIQQITEPLK